MGKRSGATITLLGLMVIGGMLSGCATTGSATDLPSRAATTPTAADSSGSTDNWPDGADADTPSCQDASPTVLARVNDSLHEWAAANGAVETVLPWLSARPDPDLGVWTLTGLMENAQTAQGSEGGYFVVFSTAADPTSATFDGPISALGVAGSVTTLPPLEPAYVGPSDMEDVPPAALGCGSTRAAR